MPRQGPILRRPRGQGPCSDRLKSGTIEDQKNFLILAAFSRSREGRNKVRKPFRNAASRESLTGSTVRAGVLDYVLTVALCALALPLTLALPGAHSNPILAFFLAAIAVSAWRGGWRPAVLAIVLVLIEGAYCVFPPLRALLASPALITRFAALLALVISTAIVFSRLRTSEHRNRELLANEREAREAAESAAARVQESERRLQEIIDGAPETIVFLKDVEGRFITINSGLEKELGVTRDALRGKTDYDVLPRERAEYYRAYDRQVLTTGPVRMEEVALLADGKEHVFLANKFPLIDANGKPYATCGILADITERKRAEEELRASEERLRLLDDNLPNSLVYQYTHEPDGTPRFLYISAGVERLNGVKAEDVLKDAGVLHRQFLPGELPSLLEAEKISARDLSVFEREVQMQLPDGQLRWMHLLSRPRRLPDGRTIWDGVQTDITERKQTEQALLKSEKLASMGRMAASMAHEINNPLEAVTNALFLAQGVEGLPELARQYLETADAELKRVVHITRQSLGFYRESNSPTLTSVTAVLDSAVDLLRGKSRAKRAVIEKQWDGDVQVNAVPGELRQVFSNLLANSLDAIDEKGIIKLRVSAGTDCTTGNHHVRITLADNGKGVPASSRQHMFEPFFTTKGAVGTGLGLWVAKQIIEKHGGAIRVRSSTDRHRRGTVVSVVLPVGLAAARSQSGR
jgi:PAS domain S-box-containing protein